jgi:hypothetical protein
MQVPGENNTEKGVTQDPSQAKYDYKMEDYVTAMKAKTGQPNMYGVPTAPDLPSNPDIKYGYDELGGQGNAQKIYDAFGNFIGTSGTGTGGGSASPYIIGHLSAQDPGRSADFNKFQGNFYDFSQNLMQQESPYQVASNVAMDALDSQLQQAKSNLQQQFGGEDSPAYRSALRDLNKQYLAQAATTKSDYVTKGSEYDLNRQQILTATFQAFANVEDQNRQLAMNYQKINLDYARQADMFNAQMQFNAAQAAAAAGRASQSLAFQALMAQNSIQERYENRHDANYWQEQEAKWGKYFFDVGQYSGRQSGRANSAYEEEKGY